jgi:hypothetical protein
MKAPFSRVFTLEVDERPILAFEAGGNRKAQQVCNESWLLDDLSLLRSGGVRPATLEEAVAFGLAAKNDNPSDDMPLVYLIDLDGQEHRS